MTTRAKALKRALFSGLLLTVAACGTILHAGGSTADDTSKDYEPPQTWGAGIQFHFADSTWRGEPAVGNRLYGTEVMFFDGRRDRAITGKALFYSPANSVQTPWSRLWPRSTGEAETTLQITIRDRTGNAAAAKYPLLVRRNEFYRVFFGVYTNVPDGVWISPLRSTLRSFDVPPGAKRLPSDSLWVGYYAVPRDCFDCPF